jgi:outer membrane protein assembly factor BamB
MRKRNAVLHVLASLLLGGLAVRTQANPAKWADVHGGLIVQVGMAAGSSCIDLAAEGRYLIQILAREEQAVVAERARIREAGLEGLATVVQVADYATLPYAERLVNLVIVHDATGRPSELKRVIVPGGGLVVRAGVWSKNEVEGFGFEYVHEVESDGTWLVARNPWPKNMDTWSHPRHHADGNAVSMDTLVGPPERVRWVAAATSEVEGLVSDAGRNFYGGLLARDSFNGLRLWHRDLRKGDHNSPNFTLPRLSSDRSRPVVAGDRLIAFMNGALVALDAATGEVRVTYAGTVRPQDVLVHQETVIAADETHVRAYQAETGKELWTLASPDPRNLAASSDVVSLIQGRPKRGEPAEAVAVDLYSGDPLWKSEYAWLPKVTRTVMHRDRLAYEVSSMTDHDKGNALHLVNARTGEAAWSKSFPPGMNHRRQARAMFIDDQLWILHGAKTNTGGDREDMVRVPTRVSALDPATGETKVTHKAGMAHCFPPVATPNYIFAGEFDLTDLKTGEVKANRITKANCSRENGWVPANGLIYTTPKHCTCWPMLRGYVAMAPELAEDVERVQPAPLKIGLGHPDSQASTISKTDWPLYRHDAWRSASTTAPGPTGLKLLWSAALSPAGVPSGPIGHDWKENPFVKGPLTPPVIAGNRVVVARPDAHEVIALERSDGTVRWRYTADGRVDTPPALYRDLCIFGTHGGSVHALKVDTGALVWRYTAAPGSEQIVAYGQLESAWPVPGAVLMVDDLVCFPAGRQPLADGGIRIIALDPFSGQERWIHVLDTLPQKSFYENSGLEFDPLDILQREGDGVSMSRWVFSRDGKQMKVNKWDGFCKLDPAGEGAVYVPRGSWSYGARHQHRFRGEAPRRPLCTFRASAVFSSLNGTSELFRRDFDLEGGETFESNWITGWAAGQSARKGGQPYRTYRMAEGATWIEDPYDPALVVAKRKAYGTQVYNNISGLVLAGNDRLFTVHKDGRMKVLSAEDGSVLREAKVPPPVWDGLAVAGDRLYLSTLSGELICLGE